MEIRGRDAEKRSAAAARIRRGLSWKAWAADLDEHLLAIEQLFSPQLFIIGGGVSKRADQFIPRLTVRARSSRRACATTRGSSARRWRRPRPSGRRWSSDHGSRPSDGGGRHADGHRRSSGRRRGRPDLRGRRAAPGHDRSPRRRWAARRTSIGPSRRPRPAFEGDWGSMAASDRGRLLLRFADAVRAHEDELSALESRQIGKPISGARWEVGQVSRVLEFYAGATTKLRGSTIPVTRPGLDLTLREPIGVVGLIVPWNFPLMMASWKVGPALAAGNTAILKPASYSPLTAIRLAELALEAGLPPGVLNVVTGPGPSVGAAMAAHPGIGKIAFTGETATGQEILRTAAGTREEGQPRARRQEPQHRVRRRRPRGLRRGVALRRVRQLRPGLLRAQPDPRRAVGPRARGRAVRRGDGAGAGRRPVRPRTEVGPLVSFRAARAGRGLRRERPVRGRDAGDRRRPAVRIRRSRRVPTSCRRCSTTCRPTCGSRARRCSGPSSA